MINYDKAIESNLCGIFKDTLIVKNATIKELTCSNYYCESIITKGYFISGLNKSINYEASANLIFSYTHLRQIAEYFGYLIWFFMGNFAVLIFTRKDWNTPFNLKNIIRK